MRNKSDAILWSALCYLTPLIWIPISLLNIPLPLSNFYGPFAIGLLKQGESDFVKINARESLNFQLSLLIYRLVFFIFAIAFFFIYTLVFIPETESGTAGAASIFSQGILRCWNLSLAVAGVTLLAGSIQAARHVWQEEGYLYPFILRIVKID